MDPISMMLNELYSTTQVSIKTLGLLDAIRTLQKDVEGNIDVLPSMKNAYCSVAVAITVKELTEPVREGAFEEMVQKLWKGRGRVVKVLEDGIDTTSLGTKYLWAWSQLITNPEINREILEGLFGTVDALADLKNYVKDERRKIGGGNDEEESSKKKRKHVEWTSVEDLALTVGVLEHENRWKLILDSFKEIFQRAPEDYRTPVDLKDRWRVLKRRNFE